MKCVHYADLCVCLTLPDLGAQIPSLIMLRLCINGRAPSEPNYNKMPFVSLLSLIGEKTFTNQRLLLLHSIPCLINTCIPNTFSHTTANTKNSLLHTDNYFKSSSLRGKQRHTHLIHLQKFSNSESKK